MHMRIKPVQLQQTNQLINDYRAHKTEIIDFFDYQPFEGFAKRLSDLQHRTFNREQLSAILGEMNERWGAHEKTFQQINQLKEENSVVVIGGQQAGLLTGPMYTINKIITIIKLAREQEEELQVPVIPVFWIAGEDHDYDEINHMYSMKDTTIYKHTTKQQQLLKKSISHFEIDKDETLLWVKQAFQDLIETEYSKGLFEKVAHSLEQSTNFVDFFARLIFELFPDEGLVLIDSADAKVRQLESSFFQQFIEKQRQFSEAVYETVQTLEQKGYTIPLDVEREDANLFFHDNNNERILLKRLENIWVGKNDEIDMTTEQLVEIAQNHPERLSNNVITRPIMQEMLFPTLAFVGGDGEISYWAALKEAFHTFDLYMPPVIPRLSFTFVTKRIDKLLKLRVIETEDVINGRGNELKINWLMTQEHPPIEEVYAEVKRNINQIHEPLQQLSELISTDLSEVAGKNLQLIHNNISFLKRKTIQTLEKKYEDQLNQFTEIIATLQPNDVLQERIWSPLPLINGYGSQFVKEIIDSPPLSLQNNHYAVYLN